RSDYYLVKGRVDAPVEPVPWMGLREAEPWTKFGRNLAIIVSGITLVMMLLGRMPTAQEAMSVLPLLPAVLLFAAMNAFNEELPGRAALLSQLVGVVGKQQALLLTAALFGLGHFYGVPPGLSGVLLAGFFGWLLSKSMVETEGFFWAWTIHFLQDVLIFAFLAMVRGG
ncbi:MAG: CPBP family intramembrane metalloprotease, partial [Caldilineae bacterium]